MLNDGQVDVAFVQGGTAASVENTDTLVSLGSLYFEPLWLFHRLDLPIEHVTDLKNHRVAVGQPGSGSYAIAMALLDINHIDKQRS